MQFHNGGMPFTGKPIPRARLILFGGFAVAVLLVLASLPDAAVEQSNESVTPARSLPPLSSQVTARIRYRDSLASIAAQLQLTEMHYSLQGVDSSELTTTFGPSTDESVVENYLTGASRKGYPLEDAVMRRLGFKVTRSANAYGAVWERKVGGRARYVARSDSAVEATVAGIQRIEVTPTSDGHHFNANVPLFVSKEALKVAVRMINQGMTDPDILAPYTVCSAHEGDSFILLDGSWTVSKVMLTDGASRGCQGWTANEFTRRK